MSKTNRANLDSQSSPAPGELPRAALPDRSNPDWWDARYVAGDVPWDSGITPPEVVAVIESGRVERGWALDLGCGSGVTSRYLASRGFTVVGIDFSHAALTRGAAAARTLGLSCLFTRGDVADFRFARVAATFAVDVGCFHSLTPQGRVSYIQALAIRLAPGAYYLLYTFLQAGAADGDGTADESARPASRETPQVSYSDIAAFAPRFALRWAAHGEDRSRHSAWFLMQRC